MFDDWKDLQDELVRLLKQEQRSPEEEQRLAQLRRMFGLH